MTLDVITSPDAEMMALSLADRIAGELRQQLDAVGRASLCVPGGSTPGPMFRALSGLALDWARVTVLLNDERWVPGDHPRSNSAMLRKTLLPWLEARGLDAAMIPGTARAEDVPAQVYFKLATQMASAS